MTAVVVARPAAAELSRTPSGQPWPIELLWESVNRPVGTPVRGGTLPDELRARFAARLEMPLRTDRPTVIAGFVTTLDGVAALDQAGASGGREISGGSEPDRFVMGLLRATADVVLVGAGTARSSRSQGWTPGHAHPASSSAYAGWRRSLGLDADGPATVLVSASGNLEARHLPAGSDRPIIIATTDAGANRLAALARRGNVEIVPVADAPRVPVDALLTLLGGRGFGLVLSEGGPSLFGGLLAARLVDELFLTVAPQLAGRSDRVGRRCLVDGTAFSLADAPWARLRSVMRSADHLFLRYQFRSVDRKETS